MTFRFYKMLVTGDLNKNGFGKVWRVKIIVWLYYELDRKLWGLGAKIQAEKKNLIYRKKWF